MKKLLMLCVILVAAGSFAFAKGNAEPGKSIPTTPPEMPIVKVSGGQLKGFVEGDGTLAFTGVRYAVAERFGKPQPVPAWQGIKPAQVYGPIPMVPEQTAVGYDEFVWPHRYYIQSEDCQYLNLWTQTLSSSAKKPVMIFIHGGSFNNGSAMEAVSYEGGNLSKFGDVVVITVNHRINVLGYLDLSSFGDAYKDTTNLGQLDLIAALQWVQENVAQFGGDPNNVTIFGQSGGCRKVQSLLHMPAAEGLFSKAIGHSSIYNPITQEQANRIGQLTVQKLGLTAATLDQIKTIDYRTLLAAGVYALGEAGKEYGISFSGWNVSIDNVTLLATYPEFAKSIPFIQGTVFSEAANNNLNLIAQGINKNTWTAAETDQYLAKRFGSDAAAVKAAFTGLFPEKKPQDAFFYDIGRRGPTLDYLVEKAQSGSAPVYNYLFAFEAPVNGGVLPFHCSELTYVFHNVNLREVTRATGGTVDVYKMQDVMAQAWINFARTGNPSQPGLEWKPFDPATKTGTLVFDTNSRFAPLDDQNLRQIMAAR
ncbi:para-nitroBenzyl esterase (pnb carboxy-esterase)(intracellular esterase b) (pnbce) [Treponema primitia ZAS-2]|uniref:Carboxylic ester hydrolase n=1 Tax=Treponema primitia (strain ATCC BAA-887 / DSM 12427 / ZAS-2) TaxID=545694 RepID=F5YQV1_TREPZ|nr:carboxylesterase family protein [Treponema primitia]AEF85072.1 para-nitroBenzyl esterase (pnb carboxy-esterase)(intracellular esterase b) (pnbce) [Treponema primitia ZAS-2]